MKQLLLQRIPIETWLLGNNAFIDIGAGDGYFSNGMAYSNFFKKIYAFEINQNSQENIKENAQANNCINRINIFGEANYIILKDIINFLVF